MNASTCDYQRLEYMSLVILMESKLIFFKLCDVGIKK
jgi:hypothetical protein